MSITIVNKRSYLDGTKADRKANNNRKRTENYVLHGDMRQSLYSYLFEWKPYVFTVRTLNCRSDKNRL